MKKFCHTTTFTGSPYRVNAFILWKFKILWFIDLSMHHVSAIHITLNSSLSVINWLKKPSKFFCKLLIFGCRIEKLLLSKCFKFREDSSRVKYCESLKLKVLNRFSSGSCLSLFSILLKSKVLEAIDSISAFQRWYLFGNQSHNITVNNKNTSKEAELN